MSDEKLYAYVVSFDGSITRSEFTRLINRDKKIVNWYACLPYTVFVVSALFAKDLADLIHDLTGVERLIVLDAHTDRNGWLPKVAWEFLHDPKVARNYDYRR